MEERTARDWYWWLWLSPGLTVPVFWGLVSWMAPPLAVLAPALFHLFLIVPATNRKSMFVRWHGRQALLLAAVRTVVPLMFVETFGFDFGAELCALPILIAIWFFGTLFSQRQAARGECILMRWLDRADAQPAVVRAREAAQEASQGALQEADANVLAAEAEADALVEVIRYSRDPDKRRQALAKLKRLGMVESL